MSNDLVAHLRKSATEPCDGCCYGESMVKAAAEIDRLRAALERIAHEYAPEEEVKSNTVDCWLREIARLAIGQQNG